MSARKAVDVAGKKQATCLVWSHKRFMPRQFLDAGQIWSSAATRRHCADEPSPKGLVTLELMNQLLPLAHVYLVNADTVPQHEQMAVRTIQCFNVAYCFSGRLLHTDVAGSRSGRKPEYTKTSP